LPGNDLYNKRRRSRPRAWRDGLADQTVVQGLEDVRSYRAFERALIGSADPRSIIELALIRRLANLLWRLGRACAIQTRLFEIQGELLLAPAGFIPRVSSIEQAHHSDQWPWQRPVLERSTRFARQRTKAAVKVHACTARPVLEVPRHRPMFSAPFQS